MNTNYETFLWIVQNQKKIYEYIQRISEISYQYHQKGIWIIVKYDFNVTELTRRHCSAS